MFSLIIEPAIHDIEKNKDILHSIYQTSMTMNVNMSGAISSTIFMKCECILFPLSELHLWYVFKYAN